MSGTVDTSVVVDKVQPSYLDMSDEELLAAPAPDFSQVTPVLEAPDTGADDDADEVVAEVTSTEAEADADEGGDQPTEAAATADAGGEDKEVKETKAVTEPKALDAKVTDKTEAKVDDKTAPKVETPKEEVKVDFEAEYKKLLAPFKANGKEIAVDNLDDARALMQMGANYNKKMAAMKPSLKILKTLENNGLLDEAKIGFLIDLAKKDPGAINKLVKDSGIDPMDLDADKASAYKQTAYAVDDREIELDTVLDELQSSPTYTRTLDVVSNKWDVASKQIVSQKPELLKLLDDHMARGIYEVISTEVERGRMLGRLNGLSDIEAYRQVGDAINARGGFNHLAPADVQPKPVEKVVVTPKPKVDDDKLKDKRRAASSTQPAVSSGIPKDFNPLDMSDEEFSKLATPKFR